VSAAACRPISSGVPATMKNKTWGLELTK